MPPAAGRDCRRAEAGIPQWSSISGQRGTAVDNSPFCSLLSAELLAPHTEASVLLGNGIKKQSQTTTKPLRANLCHPAYKPRDGQLSSAPWCVALYPAASLEVQAEQEDSVPKTEPTSVVPPWEYYLLEDDMDGANDLNRMDV